MRSTEERTKARKEILENATNIDADFSAEAILELCETIDDAVEWIVRTLRQEFVNVGQS